MSKTEKKTTRFWVVLTVVIILLLGLIIVFILQQAVNKQNQQKIDFQENIEAEVNQLPSTRSAKGELQPLAIASDSIDIQQSNEVPWNGFYYYVLEQPEVKQCELVRIAQDKPQMIDYAEKILADACNAIILSLNDNDMYIQTLANKDDYRHYRLYRLSADMDVPKLVHQNILGEHYNVTNSFLYPDEAKIIYIGEEGAGYSGAVYYYLPQNDSWQFISGFISGTTADDNLFAVAPDDVFLFAKLSEQTGEYNEVYSLEVDPFTGERKSEIVIAAPDMPDLGERCGIPYEVLKYDHNQDAIIIRDCGNEWLYNRSTGKLIKHNPAE